MRWALLDTNIYIGLWEQRLYEEALGSLRQRYVIRHSAVVLSELRRGARTQESRRRVEELRQMAKIVWEPTQQDWWEAGRLVQQIGDGEGWEVHKRREFQNDALIALTARRHGAVIATANHADFDKLGRAIPLALSLL